MSTPRCNSLDEWLSWMETLHPSEIDLGLGRISAVAQKLDILQFDGKVVTAAGTNGKGSFVHSLSQLLLADGFTVGAYTSPHISSYNERIQINGLLVSDSAICEAFSEIDRLREDTSLTYFEFGTLAALWLFKKANVDILVLEVGLGGRLDAVNIVDPDICVITSIGLDHESWLGNDRETIGAEKAGILRSDVPFICVEHDIPSSVILRANELKCRSYFLGETIRYSVSDGISLILKTVSGEECKVSLSQANLPLPSMLAAAQVYTLLSGKMSLSGLGDFLSGLSLEGRFERIIDGRHQYILDVAHNPQAAELLANNLKRAGYHDVIAVVAAMQDKDIGGIVKPIVPYINHWVSTEVPNMHRSASTEAMTNVVAQYSSNITVEKDVNAAFLAAKKLALAAEEHESADEYSVKPILILGSFYLISEFKAELQARENNHE